MANYYRFLLVDLRKTNFNDTSTNIDLQVAMRRRLTAAVITYLSFASILIGTGGL